MKYIKKRVKYIFMFLLFVGALLLINKGFNIVELSHEITASNKEAYYRGEQVSSINNVYIRNDKDGDGRTYIDTNNTVVVEGDLKIYNMNTSDIKVRVDLVSPARRIYNFTYYTEIVGNKYRVTFNFNAGNYTKGTYRIYIYTSGTTNAKKTTFTMLNHYYSYNISAYKNGQYYSNNTMPEIYGNDITSYDFVINNEQGINFNNNYFSVNVYDSSWNDVTNKYFTVENQISSNHKLVLKNNYSYTNCTYNKYTGYTCSKPMVAAGNYTVRIKYRNASYSTACGESDGSIYKYYSLKVKEPYIEFTNNTGAAFWANAYSMTNNNESYEISIERVSETRIVFYEDGKEQNMLKEQFRSNYGINPDELLINDSSFIVYHDEENDIYVSNYFNGVFTFTTLNAETEEYVETTLTSSQFKAAYPLAYTILTGEKEADDDVDYGSLYGVYSFNSETGALQIVKTGDRLKTTYTDPSLSQESTDLKSSTSGLIWYNLGVDNYVNDISFANATYRIFKVEDTSGEKLAEPIEVDANDDGFEVKWTATNYKDGKEIEDGNISISYKREKHYLKNDTEYAGGYELRVRFPGKTTDNVLHFQIVNGDIDYYTTSYYDRHEKSDSDILKSEYPNSNKKYEYYIGLNLVTVGSVITNRTNDQISIRIFDHMVDNYNEETGKYTYYDQIDYQLDILKYINNMVTFDVTIDGVKTNKTMPVSEFKTQYEHAYNMLNNYNYDSSGNIITGNNFTSNGKTITLISYVNAGAGNVTYLDENGEEKVTTLNGFANLYTDAYIKLINYINVPESGTIEPGKVMGFYKDYISEGHEVTSQFNITFSENLSDLKNSIVILPKTEVNPGKYYTYVSYGASNGVGYINNKDRFCSVTGEKGKKLCSAFDENIDLPLNKIEYPEMYNRNVHRVEIQYSEPLYEMEFIENEDVSATCVDENGVLVGGECVKVEQTEEDEKKCPEGNMVDGKCIKFVNQLFTNAEGSIKIPTRLKYIYDLENEGTSYFTYKVINSSNSDVTAHFNVNNPFTEDTEIAKLEKNIILNYKGDKLATGNYKLTVYYKGSKVGTYEFEITDKYYNFYFETKNVEFYKNYEETKKIKVPGFAISDINYFSFSAKQDTALGYVNLYKSGNSFYLDEGLTKEVFRYTLSKKSSSGNDSEFEFDFSYVENESISLGDYIITGTYVEPGNIKNVKELTVTILKDKHVIELKNERPYIDSTGMHYIRDLNIDYIKETELDNISIIVEGHDELNRYVDVSSSNASNKVFEQNELYWDYDNKKGYVDYIINENKVDYEDQYKLDVTYVANGETEQSTGAFGIPVQAKTTIGEYYSPKVNKFVTNGIYMDVFKSNVELIEVDGFYKNLPNTKISAEINTFIKKDVFKWKVTNECDEKSCSPTSAVDYNSYFTPTIEYDENNFVTKISLFYEDEFLKLPTGKMSLVLYYNNSIYSVNTFNVVNKYVYIEFKDAEIKTNSAITESGYENGLFADASGYIKIPAIIRGVDLEDATMTITKNGYNGGYINSFEFVPSEYEENRNLLFKYNGEGLTGGSYQLRVENNGVFDTLDFVVGNNFFNYVFKNRTYEPNPLMPNAAGKVTYKIETERLVYDGRFTIEQVANMFVDNLEIGDFAGNDVTNCFKFETKNYTSSTFDLIITFEPDDLEENETYIVTSVITYNNYSLRKQTAFTLGDEGLIKQILLTNLTKSSDTMYADKDGYYLYDVTLTDMDGQTLYVEIFDAKENLVYSDFDTEIKNFNVTKGTQYRISIIPYKARVGTYTIRMYNSDKSVTSNDLKFTIDDTNYKLQLTDDSYVKSSVNYGNNNIYNKEGIQGYYEFTTDYVASDPSVYTVRVYKDLKLVKEITGTDFTNKNSNFTFNEFDEGDYEIAMCINGLPYDSKTINVKNYVETNYLSLNINGSILSNYTLINGTSYNVRTIINPTNASDVNYQYIIGNESIISYKNGVLTAKATGTTTFTVKNSEKTYKVNITVNNKLTSYKFNIDYKNRIIYVPSKMVNSNNELTYSNFVKNLNGLTYGYKIKSSSNSVVSNPKYIGTGMRLDNVNETYDIVLYGDANGDGIISSKDYVKIKNNIMGTNMITNKYQKLGADANLDGSITSKDYVRIKNIIMNGAN